MKDQIFISKIIKPKRVSLSAMVKRVKQSIVVHTEKGTAAYSKGDLGLMVWHSNRIHELYDFLKMYEPKPKN